MKGIQERLAGIPKEEKAKRMLIIKRNQMLNKNQKLVKYFKNEYFKIFIILFLIWIGYCAYLFSQNGRYLHFKGNLFHYILDTRTGEKNSFIN